MKTFYFTRTVINEEQYSVEMSDSMSNHIIAKKILKRTLEEGKDSEAVKLLRTDVVKNNKIEWSK
jgi:hypothetical protein